MKQKEKYIRKLLEITKVDRTAEEVMNMMMKVTPLPDAVKIEIEKLFRDKENTKPLIDGFVAIYDEFFSLKEIKEILKFYDTPTGRKMVDSLTSLSPKLSKLSQEWGEQMYARVKDKIADIIEKYFLNLDKKSDSLYDNNIINEINRSYTTSSDSNNISARMTFSLKYAKEKGWGTDITKLTLDQIKEIREQEGWKFPESNQ